MADDRRQVRSPRKARTRKIRDSSTLATLCIIFGSIALLLAITCVGSFLALPIGVAALIVGFFAVREIDDTGHEMRGHGLAVLGTIFGLVAVTLVYLFYAAYGLTIGGMFAVMSKNMAAMTQPQVFTPAAGTKNLCTLEFEHDVSALDGNAVSLEWNATIYIDNNGAGSRDGRAMTMSEENAFRKALEKAETELQKDLKPLVKQQRYDNWNTRFVDEEGFKKRLIEKLNDRLEKAAMPGVDRNLARRRIKAVDLSLGESFEDFAVEEEGEYTAPFPP